MSNDISSKEVIVIDLSDDDEPMESPKASNQKSSYISTERAFDTSTDDDEMIEDANIPKIEPVSSQNLETPFKVVAPPSVVELVVEGTPIEVNAQPSISSQICVLQDEPQPVVDEVEPMVQDSGLNTCESQTRAESSTSTPENNDFTNLESKILDVSRTIDEERPPSVSSETSGSSINGLRADCQALSIVATQKTRSNLPLYQWEFHRTHVSEIECSLLRVPPPDLVLHPNLNSSDQFRMYWLKQSNDAKYYFHENFRTKITKLGASPYVHGLMSFEPSSTYGPVRSIAGFETRLVMISGSKVEFRIEGQPIIFSVKLMEEMVLPPSTGYMVQNSSPCTPAMFFFVSIPFSHQ